MLTKGTAIGDVSGIAAVGSLPVWFVQMCRVSNLACMFDAGPQSVAPDMTEAQISKEKSR